MASPRSGAGGQAPTIVDVSRLSRQPGSMLEVARELPAPADLVLALARVPEGSPIDVDLTLESVVEGIWVSGAADVEVTAECSRCLDPIAWNESVALEQMFRYPPTDARGAVIQTDDDDTDTPLVIDDTIDLEGPLRDAIVLALPIAPLCSPDCQGLCPECGERIDDVPHFHPVTDPRWAALESLLESDPREPDPREPDPREPDPREPDPREPDPPGPER